MRFGLYLIVKTSFCKNELYRLSLKNKDLGHIFWS